MNNKKQLILSIGLTLILVLMIVGISYAAFQFTGLGSRPNTITTGAITMSYEESTNVISMSGALPTTDATGKVRLTEGEYFDFTIKSNIQGNANINWEIAAEDITPSSAKKMAGKNIKLYLTKLDDSNNESQVMAPKVFTVKTSENTKTGRPSGMMSLATGTMSTSETTKYRLRMYVDEDYNPQGDGGDLSFSVKINAYGKVKEEPTGSKLKAYASDGTAAPSTDFHTKDYKSKTTSIVTKNNNEVPATAIESWDLSEAGDGSVMAYAEDDGTGNGTYKVTIGGKGGIIANESMIGYFADFDKMTSIDLSTLDTSEVTNMQRMFMGCSSLTSLDLSNFDTSNVTNMAPMFMGCSSLTSLDLSNFDTSNVTNMGAMFMGCSSLTSLDLSSFDTSNVTTMTWMFGGCSNLTSLDLSNFDTSNVPNMTRMFEQCSSLVNLDVSNFNTSNVTNMAYMFSQCSSLANLDVSNFNTSNVTNMAYMFSQCSSLANLDVSNFNTSNVTNMSNMFKQCSSLTSLNLSNFDTSKVTRMISMFAESLNLSTINVSNKWVIGSSTNVTNMFSNCGTDHVTTV